MSSRSGLGIWPLDNGVRLDIGALGIAVLWVENFWVGLGARLLCSGLLCLPISGTECIVFAGAIFLELMPEKVEDMLSGLNLFLLWVRGATPTSSFSELREELGLGSALLADLFEGIFTVTLFVLLECSFVIGLL